MRISALEGIRVLDVSRVLAGPYCAQLLADNGAEVIKVEAPSGDENRYWPPLVNGESPNFMSVNRGKKHITINLKVPEGQALLHRLAGESDVLIQNFLPDRARQFAVDYETIAQVNPDLIYVAISGYGARGPLRNRPGYDTMLNAYCGIMSMTGDPDRPPVRSGVSALDMTTGMLAYGAVTTALFARATGKAGGQRVDLSLLESGVSLLSYHAANWTVAGHLSRREGSRNTRLVPYGPYCCKDGELIMIGAPNEQSWQRLCKAIEAPHLMDEPKFANLVERCRHEPDVRAAMEAVLASHPAAYWFDILDRAGVACAPINTIDAVLQDEQVLANEMVVEATNHRGENLRLLGIPFKFSATPGKTGDAPPPVGADTEEVLRNLLKLGGDDIAALRDNNAI